MYVEAHDVKPPSLLTQRHLRPVAVAVGALSAVGMHGVVVGLVLVMGHLEHHAAPPEVYVDQHVVAAEFVQLGKRPDPDKLPQRRVPRKTTAPKDSVAVSKKEDPPKPEEKKEEPPPDAEEDLLKRLGDRAQAFAEIADEQEREGDPEGLREGTATEAKAGNLYAGKVSAFFKRGWTVPNTLEGIDKLRVVAAVVITADLHVGPHRIVRGSGVPLFDQSVEDRFNQLRAQGATVPEPPLEVANQYLGKEIVINFIPRAQ